MTERNKEKDSLRDRLPESMHELYDLAVSAYAKKRQKPVFSEETVNGSLVGKLKFVDVPHGVMSLIYRGVMARKGNIACGWALGYTFLKEEDSPRFYFEMTSGET